MFFILLISLLLLIYYIKKNKENFIDFDSIHCVPKTNKIIYDYDNERNIDKQFKKEQIHGAHLSTWYPNTWVEKINDDGTPIFNSRKVKENFIEPKARFSYEFNEPRVLQMDGIADPYDFKNCDGRTLQEVYDNSFVDYKKFIENKTKKNINDTPIKKAASNLSYILPDDWLYHDEKPENGGEIKKGLYAFDPLSYNNISNSFAVIDY